jgi:DNA-binding MarR family transcriptional regulator
MECGPLGQSIRFFVLRANRILSQDWTSSTLNESMHLVCYCAFALIGANPGVSLVELAKFVVVDKSRVSELIELMEGKHLIERRKLSKDHRKQGIYLTPEGIERLANITREVADNEQKIEQLYSAEERQHLLALLSRIQRY